ncbi:hypothetical protein MTO96_018463 [Rhipicephalus appendiculatus]
MAEFLGLRICRAHRFRRQDGQEEQLEERDEDAPGDHAGRVSARGLCLLLRAGRGGRRQVQVPPGGDPAGSRFLLASSVNWPAIRRVLDGESSAAASRAIRDGGRHASRKRQ